MPGREWTILLPAKNRSPEGSKQVLLVFLRAPVAGQVKTRLARDLGDERTLALYKYFVRAGLSAADAWQTGAADRQVWIAFYPGRHGPMVRRWLGDGYHFIAQSGNGLGEQMAAALQSAFDQGAGKAVIMGTDVPQVTAGQIKDAFNRLEDADIVLGPSMDGGYWLIGGRPETFTARVFDQISWGSSRVFGQTIERCRENRLEHRTVQMLRDVDTLADLRALKAYL